MINTVPKITFDTIHNIVHISDLHVRNVYRHDEYNQVFDKLYESISQIPDKNTIIIITGDIVHAKTDMSPELVDMVSEFFIRLRELFPTIIIPGNHDANLNNIHRLDAITPIVKNLRYPDLSYLRNSGIYTLANCDFIVWSLLDTPDLWPKLDYETNNLKILLYHGAVENSLTASDFKIHGHINVTDFTGADYVLLGDIHRQQYLGARIAYAGSVVQQSFSELVDGHGYILWDITNHTNKFIEIPNEYAYHTLEIHNGILAPHSDLLSSKSKVRIKVHNTTNDVLNNVISGIKSKYKLRDINIIRTSVNGASSSLLAQEGMLKSINIRDIEYQNELLKQYILNKDYIINEQELKQIYEINAELNKLISSKETFKSCIWKIKKLTFSNMFSYGDNNYIDFSDMNGSYGIFAKNAFGKSSLFDIICFMLYDKTTRTSKSDKILNTNKNEFYGELVFEIEGKEYVICKYGSRRNMNTQYDKVKVDIDFYTHDSEGNKVMLNGEERSDTNSIIRNYVGAYDNFILTTMSTQVSNMSFIDMGQSNRKDLLVSFLNLDIFDSLYDLANTRFKENELIIKLISKQNYEIKIADNATNITELNDKLKKVDTEIIKTAKVETDIQNNIEQLSISLQQVKNIDIRSTIAKQLKLLDTIKNLEQKSDEYITTYNQLIEDRLKLRDSIAKNVTELKRDNDAVVVYNIKLRDLQYERNLKAQKLENDRKQLVHLNEYEYDPNCKYCVENIFVKEARKMQITVGELENELSIIDTEIKECQAALTLYTKNAELYARYIKDKTKLDNIEHQLNIFELRKSEANVNLDNCKLELKNADNLIAEYNQVSDVIENNKQITKNINNNKQELIAIKDKLKKLNDLNVQYLSQIRIFESNNIQYTEELSKLESLYKTNKLYSIYMDAAYKDGIPYNLVSNKLPDFEAEINNILSNIVDFNITLTMDGKNINSYIVYGETFWPLEMASGMERFIASIAIRNALLNLTVLPKPNFIAIDEGLGVLDADNVLNVYDLFTYLKENFDIVLLVSHLDTARDMVNNIISINKVDGYSNIQYS